MLKTLSYKSRSSSLTQVTNPRNVLEQFWERLLKINTLTLTVTSKKRNKNFSEKGNVVVVSILEAPGVILFKEKGFWENPKQSPAAFTNVFRWKLDVSSHLITLEHLRYGKQYPEMLFQFSLSSKQALKAMKSYQCGNDTYLGSITWDQAQIFFTVRVFGSKKNALYSYVYR